MVRKAETLNSFKELQLSSYTRQMIKKKFGTDIELAIKAGRESALSNDMNPRCADQGPKYWREFVKTLDEAGFIRHDLYPRTWRIWGLYFAILNYRTFTGDKVSLATLVDRETFTSSEEYENMPAVSDEDFEKVMTTLGLLPEREQTILVLRFGLEDGKTRDLTTTGRLLHVTRERIRQLEQRALKKMRNPERLCKLPALFGFTPPAPPAEPEPEYHFSEDGTKIANIDNDIRNLNLSVRAYNCLKRFAKIDTIEDILNYPKEDWPKIKNLGRKATLEIQDKMHAVGYPDFNINLS